jgi:hypothetical protein
MFDIDLKAPPDNPSGNSATNTTIVLLDQLLRLTFVVRDLYASARYQSADNDASHLRPFFDTHYADQLRLGEVLVDRIGALHGAKGVFAATSTQATHTSYVLRALAPERLLCDLLDAHAQVLNTADTAADRDFAVGRVVLTNDLQSHSVREQLVVLQM